jgi:hypothetical protein
MSNIKNIILTLLFTPPLLLVAQGTSTAHYYIYESGSEEDSVVCIIEIYGQPEGSPGPEFEEVTLDELHARGYLTCAEQWQITPPDSVSQYRMNQVLRQRPGLRRFRTKPKNGSGRVQKRYGLIADRGMCIAFTGSTMTAKYI